MRRKSVGADVARVIGLINHCNSQVLNINEQAIIRVLFTHVSDESSGGPIVSLEQLAREASISPASVSRFIRKVGYASFGDFRTSFAREIEQIYQDRCRMHADSFADEDPGSVFDLMYQRALDNLQATYDHLDRQELWTIVRILDDARSVTIFGDDHVLSDLYTLQLDLMARGVGTYLYKNEEMQVRHAQHIRHGDVILFLTVSQLFVRPDQREVLQAIHERREAVTIGFSQDEDEDFARLFDHFMVFGRPGTTNEGFHSLWFLSTLMSEMLYEL